MDIVRVRAERDSDVLGMVMMVPGALFAKEEDGPPALAQVWEALHKVSAGRLYEDG